MPPNATRFLQPILQLADSTQKYVLVIPALDPPATLLNYVKQLKEAGFRYIVVVNDGSGKGCRLLFDAVSREAVLLQHETNRGKGAALKTAFSWILENVPSCAGIITADADGQHTVEDILKMTEIPLPGNMLLLGSRDFSLPGIPARSRLGNRLTSLIFKHLYGKDLPDTQTGLRAFPSSMLPFMIRISGERYEYEMHVLIACVRAGITIRSIPISTVYEQDNALSRFHPVRDSWRVWKVLFGSKFHPVQ